MPKVTVFDSYTSLPGNEWDDLVGDGSPFLEHTFLAGLEQTGSAVPDTGWQARPITVHDNEGRLIAAAPGWVTTHSRGEFVYDHAWADAAMRHRIPYYPKLVIGVPFTPVTGERLLVRQGEDRATWLPMLLRGIEEAARECAGVHVLFNSEAEANELEAFGLFPRTQFQFHWLNRDYKTFDDFLADFPSKKRKNIRRERRHCDAYDIRIVQGPDRAQIDAMHRFYVAQCDQFGHWGSKYLTQDMFHHLQEHWGERLVLCLAYEGERPVAGTFNVLKGDRMYGRYWGADGDPKYLHFELCYYRTVEFCIERGVGVFEPGHGGGHKFLRGFVPTTTWSSHRIAHPGLNDALQKHTDEERGWVQKRQEGLLAQSPLKWVKANAS